MKRLLRLTLGLLAAAIVTLGFTAAASAQSLTINCYTGATCITNVTINNFNVAPGGVVVINGSGFFVNTTVTVIVASEPTVVGTPMSDSTGSFTLSFAAPTEPGEHTITATDGTNTQVLGFTVTAADGTASAGAVNAAGTLPYTGSGSSLPAAEIGAGLLAAGAAMVLVVRKRQQHMASVKVDA